MMLEHGIEVLDLQDHDDILKTTCEMTDGRSTNSVIRAVGVEARGSPGAKLDQQIAGLLPDSISQYLMKEARADRLNAFYLITDTVHRGGTISLSGGYGGMAHS
jgi:threonine dehydrogenase-like Zn-dependent dehydrogenase